MILLFPSDHPSVRWSSFTRQVLFSLELEETFSGLEKAPYPFLLLEHPFSLSFF